MVRIFISAKQGLDKYQVRPRLKEGVMSISISTYHEYISRTL